MFYLIYKTTNLVNGKYYIGKHQTKNINDGYLGSGKLLKRAVKKYGLENFHTEIIHMCKSERHMNLLERILVVPDSELNYNLCSGGKGGFGYINSHVWSAHTRNEHNKKVTPFKHGHVPSEQTRLKISQSKIGNKSFFDKQFSENHRNNISLSKKGVPNSGGEKRRGANNGSFGSCWVTKEGSNKKIPKKELGVWIDKGYSIGRVCIITK